MTEHEIEIRNELIAEYVKARWNALDGWNFGSFVGPYQGCEFDLKFHTSWDWLMPVVEKIRTEVICENFNINIGCDCMVEGLGGLDIHIYCDNDLKTLDVVWLSVVKFIEFYNSIEVKQWNH